MNIFAVDSNAERAANALCLNHVCRLILDCSQLLSMTFASKTIPSLPYPNWNESQYNHPCVVWTRGTIANWSWIYSHGLTLCERYNRVYGRRHNCQPHFDWYVRNYTSYLPSSVINSNQLTPFIQCMPEQYKNPNNAYLAYRNYYIAEKAEFAKWESLAAIPNWWPQKTNRFVRISR